MPADKCYTKKNNNGGSYTTCVNKKGDQLREKDVKPKKKKLVLKVKKEEPAKPAPKKKKLVLKVKKEEPAKPAPKKKKKIYLKKPATKTRPKPPPPPGMSQADADVMVKDVLNYNKINSATQDYETEVSEYDRILSATTSYNTNNVSDYNKILTATTAYEARQNTTTAAPLQNVSAITAATSASAPRAAPPAANYNMLRPELRKHIIGYIRGEEFSPSKMKKAQLDRMYGMIEDDNDFGEVQHDRFSEHLDYGGEYREGYFQDKYGDTHLDRFDRAETKFRKQTKTGFISFLKEGGDTRRTRVPGKYDKKTIKELRDVYFDDY